MQRHFIDGYEGYLKSANEGSIHLLFADPMHLVHNTLPGACWQERGSARTFRLSSNTGRRRLNILGAVDAVTKRWNGFVTEENCDKEAIKALLETVRKGYPDGKPIVLFLDNARYQRAYDVQDHALGLNIFLVFLPPYSPNLNLIERVWKLFKKQLRNTYRKTFQEFRDATMEICARLDTEYLPEVSRLINHKFQILV